MAMEILKFPRRYTVLLLKGAVEGRVVGESAAFPYFLEGNSGQDSVFGRDQTALDHTVMKGYLHVFLKGVGNGGGAYQEMLRCPFQRNLFHQVFINIAEEIIHQNAFFRGRHLQILIVIGAAYVSHQADDRGPGTVSPARLLFLRLLESCGCSGKEPRPGRTGGTQKIASPFLTLLEGKIQIREFLTLLMPVGSVNPDDISGIRLS